MKLLFNFFNSRFSFWIEIVIGLFFLIASVATTLFLVVVSFKYFLNDSYYLGIASILSILVFNKVLYHSSRMIGFLRKKTESYLVRYHGYSREIKTESSKEEDI